MLQKSKIGRHLKSRESRILGDSAAAILCGADTKLSGCFLMSDEVPHVSSHKTQRRESLQAKGDQTAANNPRNVSLVTLIWNKSVPLFAD